MTTEYRWIPRNEAGTRATLYTMLDIARHGYMEARPVRPEDLDRVLRASWKFVPEDVETVRTIGRMMADLNRTRRFEGDCDDAATMAAAMLLRWHRLVDFDRMRGEKLHLRWETKAWFVAVRPPHRPHFAHVFVIVQTPDGRVIRIDPTAPPDAVYAGWETMLVPIF